MKRVFTDDVILLMVEAFVDGMLELNNGQISQDDIHRYVYDYIAEKSIDDVQTVRVFNFYIDE